MSQLANNASLFQTSLRRWQAEFKAHRSDTNAPSAHPAVGRRLIGASVGKRLGRRQRAGGAMAAG